MEFVAIDFETANHGRESACALGLSLVVDSQVIESRYWLIQPPDLLFYRRNIEIHGITPEDVKDAPDFSGIWDEVSEYLTGRDIVAHNWGFDASVLAALLDLFGIPRPDSDIYCSLAMARRAWPGKQEGYSLGVLAERLGLTITHHQAQDDAWASAQIALMATAGHADLRSFAGAQALKLHRLIDVGRPTVSPATRY